MLLAEVGGAGVAQPQEMAAVLSAGLIDDYVPV